MVASGILRDIVFPDPVHDVVTGSDRLRFDENGSEGTCPYDRDVCGRLCTADCFVSA